MQKFLLPLNMFKPTVFLFFMVSTVSSQAQGKFISIGKLANPLSNFTWKH